MQNPYAELTIRIMASSKPVTNECPAFFQQEGNLRRPILTYLVDIQ